MGEWLSRARDYAIASRPRIRRTNEATWMVVVSIIATAALMCTASALIARELTWTWRPTIALAALAHQLMWAAPFAIGLFLITRRGLGLILSVIAAALTVWSQAGLYFGSSAAEGMPIRVLQANLGVGSTDPDALVRLVRSRQISVAMTEELTSAELDSLVAAGLPDLLPYRLAVPGPDATGIAIWSRFPLAQEHNYSGFDFGVVSATAVIAGKSITLVAAHTVPPYPRPAAQWASELRRLRQLLRSNQADLIVGCDLNATTDNPQFRSLIDGNVQDAAQDASAGYLPTYPTDHWFGPVVAIDHVLLRGMTATRAHTAGLPGSDHRALVVEVVV